MIFRTSLVIVVMATAMVIALVVHGETHVTVKNRSENNAPKIIIRSAYDFEKMVSLKVKTDPRLIPTARLIEIVRRIGMRDANGISITSGYDINPVHDVVIGFSGGKSEIIRTIKTPNGLRIISSFKNEDGAFISPPASSLAVYNTNGEKLCFDDIVTQAPPKMAFTLLIDKSYSMVKEFANVKQTATEFLSILPSPALCAVASFDLAWTYTRPDYQSCSAGGFGIDAIQIGTATDIYAPLKDAYLKLSRPRFDGYQKAVIIITDGHMEADPLRKQELVSLKGDILTFVYFIGGNNRTHLEGLTNRFLAQRGNVRDSLLQYFDAIGQAYNTQKVLNIHRCQGGVYPSP
ncbi:MAG: hypothetical protein COA45_04085 [Zetaproteobacteria bacterium]|nr:MAG: hypothetical protein COA45_04085 [Zetaproteobacteria bacterium]